MTETTTWITCVADDAYEIYADFPHQIRRKSNGYIIKEWIKSTGYVVCRLNRKLCLKHRIIALQFIPNPQDLPQIDHINHIKTDNRIDNLRWVSASQNGFNRSKMNGVEFEFVEEIPNESIVVKDCRGWQFENLYFHNDVFYFYNGIQYRKLKICENKSGNLRVNCVDVDGKSRTLYYITFKREYNIVGSGVGDDSNDD